MPRPNVSSDQLYHTVRTRFAVDGQTSGSTPGPAGPAGPKGIAWKGNWAAGTGYEVGDLVVYNLMTFICITAHMSVTAPTMGGDSSWAEIAVGYLLVSGARAMTGDLNMASHVISAADAVDFDTTPGAAAQTARLMWDATEKTLVAYLPSGE